MRGEYSSFRLYPFRRRNPRRNLDSGRRFCYTAPLYRGRRAIRQPTVSVALIFALTLAPAVCSAGFRGAFDPLTPDSKIFNRYETPSLRPLPAADGIERYFTFTTRSATPGRETSREIWLHRIVARAGINLPTLNEARVPLLRDATGLVSYVDPAWSPDGRYLAYVRTTSTAANPTIYVQEFMLSDNIAIAATPVGNPTLVVPGGGGAHRYPAWSPDGATLAFGSTKSGLSFDIYTVAVFPTVGSPVRRTFDDRSAEQQPDWSPDGTRIAYQTNFYGPDNLAIVDLTTPSPHSTSFAEPLAFPVYHRRPSWSSDGKSLYYHAPKNEDSEQLPDIWKLDLASQSKCAISIDLSADSDADVSGYLHTSPDGIEYNYFVFTSMAAGSDLAPGTPGPNIWRGEHIYNCFAPLQLGVVLQPHTLQLGSDGQNITASLSFPASTQAAGYQCASFDGPLEGVRLRNTVLPSPTLEGLLAKPDMATGGVFPVFTDKKQSGVPYIDVYWNRREVVAYLLERGLVGRDVPLRFEAYSNGVGRRFRGFAYIKLNAESATDAAVVLLNNSPNPFNPHTTIHFATGRDGTIAIRVFNARGESVRVIREGFYPRGRHEVTWDGRNSRGQEVPSGIYYAVAHGEGGAKDQVKMVLLR